MTEPGLQSNKHEAARLFQRGVAAARGGQRRVAAGMLARAVQHDPEHEQAWLWLSGVLDDPREIAFCLRSVLTLNPHNQRAQRGLDWLQQRGGLPAPAASSAESDTTTLQTRIQAAPVQPGQTPVTAPASATHHESWWVKWRHTRRDTSRAWAAVWGACIVVLLATLGLNYALRDALARKQETAFVSRQPLTAGLPIPTPTVESILEPRLTAMNDAQVVVYLDDLARPRAQLRDAVQAYRAATAQPGGSAVSHAAAARTLREQLVANRAMIAKLRPPHILQDAHGLYLDALDQEVDAMDDMLEFYGSFSVQYANRAAMRMDQASRTIEQANILFSSHITMLQAQSQAPAYTSR